MRQLNRLVPAVALLLVASAGCARNRAPAAPPQTAAAETDAQRASREAAEREAARRAEEARTQAARADAERSAAAMRSALTATVYFEFDQAVLSDETRAALDAKLPALRSNPAIRLRVAGHTDDRGSDEYNLALAQRRGVAAKRYLMEHQIDASRLTVVGFGEERPVCDAGDESCWERNRRAEFEIVEGDVAVGVPNDE
jgi:peptidoglycan-associated lipoprotein